MTAGAKVQIVEGGLDSAEVAQLLNEHLREMAIHSPPESIHALDLDELNHSSVRFWGAWWAGDLAGCVALKKIDQHRAEIKSMRTAQLHQRKGIANQMLAFVVQSAKASGYRELLLETGSMAAFAPARQLYAKSGFQFCDPFGDYRLDPNSVFMRKLI